MTHIDLVALISTAAILLALAGGVAERIEAARRAGSRQMAHRVK